MTEPFLVSKESEPLLVSEKSEPLLVSEKSEPFLVSEKSEPFLVSEKSEPFLVSMWSGPRNVSTALMYSWRQRHDTVVFDEPFYGRFLIDHDPGHPGRDEIIAAMENDYDRILEAIAAPGNRPVRYIKHMAHHLRSVPAQDLLSRGKNVILIRDPAPVVASLSVRMGDKVVADWTGFPELIQVLDFELAHGREPLVVHSDAILANPEVALRFVTERLGLDWDPAMLSWPAGPKPEDGVWAKYWYDAVHTSTGFGPPRQKATIELDEAQTRVYEACKDSYERLASFAYGV